MSREFAAAPAGQKKETAGRPCLYTSLEKLDVILVYFFFVCVSGLKEAIRSNGKGISL